MAFTYTQHHNIGPWIKPVDGGAVPNSDGDEQKDVDSVEVLDVNSARVVIAAEAGSDLDVVVEHSDESDSNFDTYERLYARDGETQVRYDLDDVTTEDGVTYFDVRLDGAKRYVRLVFDTRGDLSADDKILWLLGNDGNIPSGYQDSYEAPKAYEGADR